MKTLLLTAALLLTVSSAHAEQRLPKEMIGKWCPIYSSEKLTTYEHNDAAPKDPNCWVITPTHMTDVEGICRFTKITPRSGNYPAEYVIEARCEGEGEPERSTTFSFFHMRGQLSMW